MLFGVKPKTTYLLCKTQRNPFSEAIKPEALKQMSFGGFKAETTSKSAVKFRIVKRSLRHFVYAVAIYCTSLDKLRNFFNFVTSENVSDLLNLTWRSEWPLETLPASRQPVNLK